MQIIISDSSCLIDLQKASLLEAFVRLPYDVCVPDVIFESELISFSTQEKNALQELGLRILELPGDGILSVQNLRREKSALSVNDCFACIRVHGILWCIDEIHIAQTATIRQLYDALVMFEVSVFCRRYLIYC